ncbi:Aldedh domain-containing protein [Fusarium keratoplasticum]|nr:Aldedh domain-containing protein [Fusarium keratoplasticum]
MNPNTFTKDDGYGIPIPIANKDLFDTRGLVAGSWKTPSNGKSFPVYEPSSGKVLRQCSDFGHQDFVDAIDVADKGYRRFWSSTTANERGNLLRAWYEEILENADDLAVVLSLENGKTLAEAQGEVKMAASYVSWFAEEATRAYGETIPSSFHDTTVLTFKEPVGVCGIITPWNFPAAMITRKIAPAFAAGCSVVIKPPSETPFSAISLAKLAVKAGIPESIIHVVPTKDRQASLELATNPKVKKLSFTGSTGVGKMLTKLAAGTMKRVSMELGGNAPLIVFEDANLDCAVQGALIAKFRCAGQTCVCANRIYVQSSVVETFTAKLVERVGKLSLGKGIEQGTTLGPLVNAAAVNKIAHQVKDAVSKGAVLRAGGKPPGTDGFFFEPTVITGATKEMEVATDETFGPLAAIFSFETEEEVIALANDTEFGLAGYFFSKDIGRVMRVARQLECGMVGVNTGIMTACESPFGGIKESGVGIEGSKYGLAEYQSVKGVTIGNLNDY